jgi:hypothetical protein
MSEILSLAERLKQKSSKSTELIEQAVQDDLKKLHESFMSSLGESETIITKGTENLKLSQEQLQTMLSEQKTAIDTALTTYLEQLQLPLSQDLKQLVNDTQTMIENYAQGIETLIQKREDRLVKIIKSEMKTWGIWASLIILGVLILGIMLGVLITNKVTKPTYIYKQLPAPASMPAPKQYRP